MTELQKSAVSPVRPRSTHLEPVQLSVTLSRPIDSECTFGLKLSDDGEKVISVETETQVDNLDQIEIGDRILTINGNVIETRNREDILQLLEEGNHCELTILRPPKIESPAGFVKSIDTSIAYYEHAIRNETEEQNKCFEMMQDLDVTSNEYIENQEKIRESKKREGDFRKKILSLQEEEKQWLGVKSLLDGEDALSLIEIYQFILFCLEKSLLYQLLFAEENRQLHTSKKPIELAKKLFSTYFDNESDFALESITKENEDLVKSIQDRIDSDQAGQSIFVELEPIISRSLFNVLDEFRTKLTTERIMSGGQDMIKSVDDVFVRDVHFQEVIKLDPDANRNVPIVQLEFQSRLLRALLELSKSLQNNSKGNAKLKSLLQERNDLLKRAKKTEGGIRSRPKSMVAFPSAFVQSGKFAVSSLKRMYTTKRDADQAPERLVPVSETVDSLNASPTVTKRDTTSIHSVDSNPSDEIELEDVEEEDPEEFELKDVVAWETLVRNEGTLDVTTISKQERARQSLIHELIIVHHNACIKINFLISIYKPKILSVSKLKASQLTPIFRNIDEIKIMFDALKVDLEARQAEQWPLIGGIGDIMLDHFNLETDKGKNFQQQVAKWVSKDNEANSQIKKWQDEKIEQILEFQKAVTEADKDPRLNKLSFNNVLTVIFQTMPRYPMLLAQILRYTGMQTDDNEDMLREKELLERAKDDVQVTVSEINKRVSEEDLNGLLTDIKTHLSIHDFLKVATADSLWGRFREVKSRLEMDKVIHYGTGKVNEIMSGKSTDVTFVLFEDSFVFFKINNLNGHKTYSIYSTESQTKPSKPGEQAETTKVFYFFAIESLHIRRNESETAKRVIYLIDKALLVSCTLDLGTNELANNLISAVSAQQAQRARNNSLSNSRAQSPIELEEKPEATSLPDDEVLNQSSSSVETEEVDVTDGTVVLDSPVEIKTPVAPPRSIRRDGFRRTAVRHVDGAALLDEVSRQINQLESYLTDSDDARDAYVSLQQIFQRYKNTLSS